MARLRLVLVAPTAGVDYGLQRGRGSHYETVQTQRSTGEDIAFEFSIDVRPDGGVGGPFVQGPSHGKFVYVDIGTHAGQQGTCWSRRLKVPLDGVVASADVQEARVPGERGGGPSCGTVKPFGGWKSRKG